MPAWWTNAHAEAVRWIGGATIVGAILGFIVTGIREVWLWRTTTCSTR